MKLQGPGPRQPGKRETNPSLGPGGVRARPNLAAWTWRGPGPEPEPVPEPYRP